MEYYYRILELEPGATEVEIKKNYRKLVMRYHPDKNPSPEAASKFLEIQNAYDALTNPDRIHYNQTYSNTETKTSSSYGSSSYTYNQQQTHQQSSTNQKQTRRSSKSKKNRFYFDHLNHSPNRSTWGFSREDFDATCLTRIVLLGILGFLFTIFYGLTILETFNRGSSVASFFTLLWLLFDIVLLIDLFVPTSKYHAYIVNIIKHKKNSTYELLMSITNSTIDNFYPDYINSKSRYRNSFYVDNLKHDLDEINQFVLHRTLFFKMALQFEGYNRLNQHLKTVFNITKKKFIFYSLLISILFAILILVFVNQLAFFVLFYFLGHFLFIREFVTSNILDKKYLF